MLTFRHLLPLLLVQEHNIVLQDRVLAQVRRPCRQHLCMEPARHVRKEGKGKVMICRPSFIH